MGRNPLRLPTYIKMQNIRNLELGYDYVIYKDGSDYIALNGHTGKEDYTDTKADVAINGAISQLTYGGHIKLMPGQYKLSEAIDLGIKSITLEGSGVLSTITNLCTELRPVTQATFGADWIIKAGSATASVIGTTVKDLFINGNDYSAGTTPLGGIQFRNVKRGLIQTVYVDDMYGTSPRGTGFDIYGDSGYGSYYNMIFNCGTRRCTTGVRMGTLSNGSTIMGGSFSGRSSVVATYGIFGDGGDTISMLGSSDLESHSHTGGTALYIKSNLGWRFFGTRFEGNYNDIVIDSGGGTGSHSFFGCSTANNTNAILADSGNSNSYYQFASGFITRKAGAAATIADGGTIAHRLASTPTYANLTGSIAGDLISITALDGTNITVAIKDEGGGAGTSQTIYWNAVYQP